ncbi:C69 family dipeptidase [Bacteroidota bacterium]
MKANYTILLLIIFPFLLSAQQQECFLLMVGKEASVNGQVLLAHNNDLSGTEASMLVKVPAYEKINIIPDNSISFKQNYEMLVLQTNIGFAEGDAAAINEHGVAVAGGLSLKKDRNENGERVDPLIPSGLGGGVRYLALQHAKTARECVKIIGELYNVYGIKYPSGVGIADTNEIWYMEAGGGYSWAAIRIPMDSYFVGANSFRIGNINFKDSMNFIFSPNLLDISKEYNLENNNDFNFRDFFGNGVKEKTGNNYYNTRRLWRAIDILNPSKQISSEDEIFPLFLQPEEKINLQKCFSILRDYYGGIKYDIFKEENLNNHERSIAVWKCVHTDVISLSPGYPVEYGAVIWTGFSSPYTAVYTPVYFGISAIPESYSKAPSEHDQNSAFWIYKKLGDLYKKDYPTKMKSWDELRNEFELNEIEKQNDIIIEAVKIYKSHPNRLGEYLMSISQGFAKDAIMITKSKIESLKKDNDVIPEYK